MYCFIILLYKLVKGNTFPNLFFSDVPLLFQPIMFVFVGMWPASLWIEQRSQGVACLRLGMAKWHCKRTTYEMAINGHRWQFNKHLIIINDH